MVVKKYGSMKAIYTGYNKEKYLPLSYSIKENTVYNIVLANIYESKNSQDSNDNFEDYYHICVFDDNGNNLDDIIYQNFKDFSLDWIFVYDHESIEPNKATAKSDTEKTQAIYCGDGMVCGLINDKIYNIKISDIFDCERSIYNKDKAHCIYCVDVYDDSGNKIINLVYDGIIPFLKNWIVVTYALRYEPIFDMEVSDKNTDDEVDEVINELSHLSPGDYKDISSSDYDYAINHLSETNKCSQFSISKSEVRIHYAANNAYIKITYKDSVQYKMYCYTNEPIFGVDHNDVSTITALITRTVYVMEREYYL